MIGKEIARCLVGIVAALGITFALALAGCAYDNVDPDSTADGAATEQNNSGRVTDGAHGAK